MGHLAFVVFPLSPFFSLTGIKPGFSAVTGAGAGWLCWAPALRHGDGDDGRRLEGEGERETEPLDRWG